MMWLLGGAYCLLIWLVFEKWRLLRLSLPIAIAAASIGPFLIVALLFCAQYYHPYTSNVRVFQKVVPIVPQMTQPGRITKVLVEPNVPINAGDVLFEVDSIPYQKTIDRLSAAKRAAEQSIGVAKASLEIAVATIKRAEVDLQFMTSERTRQQKLVEKGAASQEEFEQTLARYQQASSALEQAFASKKQAELSIELAEADVLQAQASLEDAEYDLEQTVMRAPSEGFVTNLQLEPGMLVGGAGSSSVMSFVQERSDTEQGVVVVLIEQKNFLLVKPGQYAEIVLDGYPGRVFAGRVQTTIDVSGAGQLTATGDLPETSGDDTVAKFAVRIKLDDADSLRLPAGSGGHAAIYTEHVPIAGIPVMVVLRVQSWLKYVL